MNITGCLRRIGAYLPPLSQRASHIDPRLFFQQVHLKNIFTTGSRPRIQWLGKAVFSTGIGAATAFYFSRHKVSALDHTPSPLQEADLFLWRPCREGKALSVEERQFLQQCTGSLEDIAKLRALLVKKGDYGWSRWPLEIESFLKKFQGLQSLVDCLIISKDGGIFEIGKSNFDTLYQIAQTRDIHFYWGDQTQERALFFERLLSARNSETWPCYEADPGIYMMLRTHPALAIDSDAQGKSVFSLAVEEGCSKTARIILKVIEGEGCLLSQEDRWNRIALLDLASFRDADFMKLPLQMRRAIYRRANIHGSENVVERLNALGMPKEKLPSDPYPEFVLNRAMDVLQSRKALESFLGRLRRERRLMTTVEFQTFQSQLLEKSPKTEFIKKNHLGRLIGRDILEQAIRDLGLQHVKVPQKIAVVNNHTRIPGEVSLETVSSSSCEICSHDITVYAQKIEQSDRTLHWEEMKELLTLIEHAHFGDIWGHNFVVAKDGVYFIDTEYKSFYPLEYGKLFRLSSMLDQKDRGKFDLWIAQHSSMEKKLRASKMGWRHHEKDRKELSEYFGWDKRTLPFRVPIRNLDSLNDS